MPFQDAAPTPAGDWRHIVRFGRSVASYKCALGQALLDLAAQQQTFVPLPDHAVPYAARLCEHLQIEDRQSQFLDACRSRNRGELDAAQLAEVTVRLGFTNVIDAFHVSRGGQPTQTRFFVDERASRQGITLTDHLLELANGLQAKVLPREVDARWNLVQMSWGLRLGTRLVSFEMTPDQDAVDLYAPARLRRGQSPARVQLGVHQRFQPPVHPVLARQRPRPRRRPAGVGTTRRGPAHRASPHCDPLKRYDPGPQRPVLRRWLESAPS